MLSPMKKVVAKNQLQVMIIKESDKLKTHFIWNSGKEKFCQ